MRVIDRLKNSYDLWKLNKYTKRRTAPPMEWDSQIVQGVDNAVVDPVNFSNRSPEFYDYYYEDGVYYNLPGTQGHDSMAAQRMTYLGPSLTMEKSMNQPRRQSHVDLSTLYENERENEGVKKSRRTISFQQGSSFPSSPSSPDFSERSSPSPSLPHFTQHDELPVPRRSNRRNPARNSEAYNFNY